MSAILEASSVSMVVGSATLLHDVDLPLKGGQALAIVGPNGAGKSTLLRLLSGDLRPTRGAVTLGGRDIRSYSSTALAARRAMLSQHVTVSFPFTVVEIVAMGAVQGGRLAAQRWGDAAIEEVGLTAFRNREMPTLSGGEQQRAHLARILVQLAYGEAEFGPGVLLLDEPTSSLDLRHQIALVEIANRRAAQGTAVVAVLHDLNLAVRFADRIVVMKHGVKVADGATAQTLTSQMIRDVFEVEADVRQTSFGSPYLLPQTMQQMV